MFTLTDMFAGGLAVFGLGWPEIVVIMVFLLILFGGKKLPELAKGLGKGLRTFKQELRGVEKELSEEPTPDEDKDVKKD